MQGKAELGTFSEAGICMFFIFAPMDTNELQSIKQRFGIIGNSHELNRAIEVAAMVANTDSSVIIYGESGSGKESFSKIIHQLSKRKHGEFIAINCGAIPEGTINSELFGHEKGAFTGATDSRRGYFEVTDKGTMFLDEIAEMPLETQARLLRVLENGEFLRVGSNKILKTDVRVVAATNVDLLKRVQESKFREDLFYRFAVPIHVPPLRNRGSDIELLFRKFAYDFAEHNRAEPITLTEDAKQLLLSYRFPGNIRQLKNIVDHMSVLEENRIVGAERLSTYLPDYRNRLPMVLQDMQKDAASHSGMGSSDHSDLIIKVLFEMKRDVTEMKKLILSLLKDDTTNNQVFQQYKHVFHDMSSNPFKNEQEQQPAERSGYLLGAPKPQMQERPDDREGQEDETDYALRKTLSLDEGIEDITHKMEDESLSLEKNEKEIIIKALKKNNFKRKDAARDLGISERTLYRKIKQYGIEDLGKRNM